MVSSDFFDLIYLAESYSTYNKNIVRTYIYHHHHVHDGPSGSNGTA